MGGIKFFWQTSVSILPTRTHPIPAAVVCQFTSKTLFYLIRAYNSKYCVRLQQRVSLKGVPFASFLILLVGPVLSITNKPKKTPHPLHHRIYIAEAGSLALFLLVKAPPLFPPLAPEEAAGSKRASHSRPPDKWRRMLSSPETGGTSV